jgi:hypothetical protein
VITDHLGDVYWVVGRQDGRREFQWHARAVLPGPRTTRITRPNPARIRRKLEVGLDVVLAEEGAPPLRVADDNG